ncbi:MAG: EcsC family protein [Ruminococcus sp.]|nr:EcsC family protein [Ruminococcus sp.]
MSYSHHEKELKQLLAKEQRFLAKRRNKKESAINRLLADKVPDKLQSTINMAFSKAFSLIFDKGTPIIEMTYKKDELEKDFQIDLYSARIRGTRKSLKKLSNKADIAGGVNLAVSGASGIGMGLLGMGLPDIPVFTGMILRCVYEIAIHYGFEYETEEEKYFILLLIEGAVSHGSHLEEVNKKIDDFIRDPKLPVNYRRNQQIINTSCTLSKELLYMKFLQGVPIVGAVGGAYDIMYMNNTSQYCRIKYKKRFLINYSKEVSIL